MDLTRCYVPERCSIEGDHHIGIRNEFHNALSIIANPDDVRRRYVQVLRALSRELARRAYSTKGHVITPEELLDTIRAVHAGQKRIPPEVAAELAEHAIEDELSLRELDVLRLIATGTSTKTKRSPVKLPLRRIQSRAT